MWIRSAFWMGNAKQGAESRFREKVNSELVPALRVLPGVRDAKALWPERREDNPPQIACQVLVEFDGRDDLDRMLASSERRALRAQVLDVAKLFDGAISHIEFEVS